MRNTRIGDVPPFHCFVRKEFLYGGMKRNEYEECIVIGAVLRKDMALCFTVLLESGAVWYELPLHALTMVQGPRVHSLPELQMWDCLSEEWTVHCYDHLRHLDVTVIMELENGSKLRSDGKYLFTIDMMGSFYADHPAEHKTFNIIVLSSGEIVAYPNNRCIFEDKTFTKITEERPKYVRNSAHYFAEQPTMPTGKPEEKVQFTFSGTPKPLVEEVADALAAQVSRETNSFLDYDFIAECDWDLKVSPYAEHLVEITLYSLREIRQIVDKQNLDIYRDEVDGLYTVTLFHKEKPVGAGNSFIGTSKKDYASATRKAICRFLGSIDIKSGE